MNKWLFIGDNVNHIQSPEGSFVAVLDGDQIRNDTTLFREIAKAFQFPDYFGHNWDALDECLGDLDWIPATGYVVIWQNASNLLSHASSDFLTLLDVFQYAAQEWQQKGVRMELHIIDGSISELAQYLQEAVLSPPR